MNVHEDSERLTNDDRDPHRSVAVVTVHKAAHKPGQWKLEERKNNNQDNRKVNKSIETAHFPFTNDNYEQVA